MHHNTCLDEILPALRVTSSPHPLQASGRDLGAAMPHAISLAEEAVLLRHYHEKLLAVCANLKLPKKVVSTSVSFLKRFYIRRSALEHDPQQMTLVSLYVACKVEDCYISAAELGRLVGMPAEVLLKLELSLLQGLDFDFQVHSLYRALDGLIGDYEEWASKGETEPSESQMKGIKGAAYASADQLLLTDGPLLFTPGQLALAALHEAVGQAQEGTLLTYLEHVASMGGCGGSEEQLKQVIKSVAGVKAADEAASKDEVVDIDRRLKSFRKALAPKKGGIK